MSCLVVGVCSLLKPVALALMDGEILVSQSGSSSLYLIHLTNMLRVDTRLISVGFEIVLDPAQRSKACEP